MFIEANNIQLHVKTSGDNKNPAVVLSHSLGSDMSTWDLLVPELENNFYVITLDMRGHGKSEVDGEFSFKDLASDVIAVLNKLQIDKAHFIGLSMGGMIAQALGVNFQDRLLSLTIMASMSSAVDSKQMWVDRITAVEQSGLEPLVETTLQRWFTENAFNDLPELVDKVRQLIPLTSIEGYKRSCKAIADLDFTKDLHHITVPTQIIVGKQDEGTPPALSEIIHKEISGSKLHVIENAAHQVALEQAEIVNKIVINFLSKVQ